MPPFATPFALNTYKFLAKHRWEIDRPASCPGCRLDSVLLIVRFVADLRLPILLTVLCR